jgi:hypothetical protein
MRDLLQCLQGLQDERQQVNPGVQESNPQNSETKQGIQKTPFTHSCNGDGAAIHTSTTCSIKPQDH